MENEKSDFKVVDKRHSATRETSAKEGEGFVMKESPQEKKAEPVSPSQIDFSTLCFSLATGALINLGVAPDPVTQKTQKNIELAKQNIDILSLLQEKTKGNLAGEEKQLLENLLTEVRLRFVEASSKK